MSTRLVPFLIAVIATPALSALDQPLFNPFPAPYRFQGEIGLSHTAETDVKDQDGELAITDSRAAAIAPAWTGEDDQLSLGLSYAYHDLDGTLVFPATGRLPGHLAEVEANASWKHVFGPGHHLTGMVGFGSASDRLFDSADELQYGAGVVYLRPQPNRDAWMFGLMWRNDLRILGGAPVPLIAYHARFGESLKVQFGLPFLNATWQATKTLTIASGWRFRGLGLDVDWQAQDWLTVGAHLGTNGWNGYRAERDDEDRKIAYRDYELKLDCSAAPMRGQRLTLAAGLRFDRSFNESEQKDWDDLFEDDDNEVEVEEAAFITVTGLVTF